MSQPFPVEHNFALKLLTVASSRAGYPVRRMCSNCGSRSLSLEKFSDSLQPLTRLHVLQGKSMEECLTNNRLFVYSVTEGKAQMFREVCLVTQTDKTLPAQPLYLYSAGWLDKNVMADGLLVVASLQGQQQQLLQGDDSGSTPLTVTWLSIFKDAPMSKPPSSSSSGAGSSFVPRPHSASMSNGTGMVCRTACPAFSACLSPDLW